MKVGRSINNLINDKTNLKTKFNGRKMLELDTRLSTLAVIAVMLFSMLSFYITIDMIDSNISEATGEQVTITVTFNANEGTPTSEISQTVGSNYSLPETDPTREGYTFEGWYTQQNGEGTQITDATTVVAGDAETLYAKWTAKTYTVTFNSDGGTDGGTQTVTYDSTYVLPENPTRTGYTFGGWYTQQNGEGSQITAETKVTITQDQTLYAKWTINYTLTRTTANETMGTVSGDSGPNASGTSVSVTASPNPGYKFVGWYASNNSVSTANPYTFYLTADTTLEARFDYDTYTLTLDTNGGTLTQTTKNVTYNSTYGNLPTPTHATKLFMGWYTETGGTGTEVTSETTVTNKSAHTLYAKWTESATIADMTYTGSTLTPTVTIGDLTQGTDFTVSCTDTSAGTAKATVTGVSTKGYTGTFTLNFTINSKSLTGNATIATILNAIYTGSPIAPDPVVTDTARDTTLAVNNDYTVSYSENTKVGQVTVTVTGTGNYTGSLTTTFNITAKTLPSGAIGTIQSQVYTGSTIKPEPVVTDTVRNTRLTAGTDYTVEYSSDTINKGTVTVTVTGTGNYTGILTTTFDITAKDLPSNAIGTIANQVYTGSAITPGITVTDTDISKQLTEVTDYTIGYSNNIRAGTATVTITGAGNYKGTAEKTFTIDPRALSGNATIADISSRTYTGSDITPDTTVTDTDLGELAVETDYTVEYSANIDVGTNAKVTVTGTGNYTGSLTKTFSITAKALVIGGIEDIVDQVYTGSAITPVIVKDPDRGGSLINGTDYTITYKNNTKVGTATATVTGRVNYTGTLEKTFNITPRSVDASGMTLETVANQTYTGSAITPSISLKDTNITGGGYTLINETDYTLSYSTNNTDVGEVTITITGKGNYGGSRTTTFNILAKELTMNWTTIDALTITKVYDGNTDVVFDDGLASESITKTVTLTGVNAETVTATVSGSYTNKTAGDNKTVNLTATIEDDNYTLASDTTTYNNRVITKKELTYTAQAKHKEYDGDTDATIAISNLTGKVDGDDVSLSISLPGTISGTFAQAGLGEDIAVTATTTITLSGTDSGNYEIKQPTGLKANITNALATITFNDLSAFTYNGSAVATTDMEKATISPEGATILYKYYNSQKEEINASDIVNAGTYYIKAYISDTNYSATPVEKTITVKPRSLKLEGITIDTKTYDKASTATANMTNAVLKGKTVDSDGVITADIDNVTIDSSGVTWAYSNYNAGTRTATRTGTYSLGGSKKSNYELLEADTPLNINGTISEKEIEVTVSYSNKAYNGNTTATVTIEPTNNNDIKSGDTVGYTYTATFDNANVGTNKTVTVSNIASNNANYIVTNTTDSGEASITPLTGLVAPSATLSAEMKNSTVYKGTTVSLATTSADANIYYALGTNATNDDVTTLYEGAFTINANTTIRAVTRKTGYVDSDVVTFTYTVRTIDHVLADIEKLGVGDGTSLNTILSDPSEKALLDTNEKLKKLLQDLNASSLSDKKAGILTKVLTELKGQDNEKTFIDILEEEINVADVEVVLGKLASPMTLETDENLEAAEAAMASYEKLTSVEREKLSAGSKEIYQTLLENYDAKIKSSNCVSSVETKEVYAEAVGLVTQVTKSAAENKVALNIEPKEAEEVKEISVALAGVKTVLAYDIKITEETPAGIVTTVDSGIKGNILLKIKIPTTLKDKNPEIHHLSGTDEISESTRVAGQRVITVDDELFIVFETNSFSPFVITATEFHMINISCGENGTVTPSGLQEITAGEQFPIDITPNTGYEINQVLVNDVKQTVSGNRITLTGSDTDVTVRITFKKKTATSSAGGGSSSGGGGSSTFVTSAGSGSSASSHMSYMSGYEDGTFGPSDYITREQVATIFSKVDVRYNIYDNYTNVQSNPKFVYTDVLAERWSSNYIGYVAKIDAMTGYEDSTFKPENNITRAEFAAALVRYKGIQYEGKTSKFKDVKGEWFENYVAALEELGYVSGYEDGTYGSKNFITRAEVCIMMNNVLGRTADAEKIKALGEGISKFSDVKTTDWYYANVMEATNSHISTLYH